MANELTVQSRVQELISSPALRKLRAISTGTIQWPGKPLTRYLSGGLTLTDEQKAAGEQLLDRLKGSIAVTGTTEERQSRLAVITKMLLAYPVPNASLEAGRARAEAYLDALDDVPPWAIAAAVKRWHRGECGQDYDYHWAPAPAALRGVSMRELMPVTTAMADLEHVLTAVSLDEAMETSPEERERVKKGFASLQEILRERPKAPEPEPMEPQSEAAE